MSAMGGTDEDHASSNLHQIVAPGLIEQVSEEEEPNMVDSSVSSNDLSPTMKKVPTCMFNNSQRTAIGKLENGNRLKPIESNE